MHPVDIKQACAQQNLSQAYTKFLACPQYSSSRENFLPLIEVSIDGQLQHPSTNLLNELTEQELTQYKLEFSDWLSAQGSQLLHKHLPESTDDLEVLTALMAAEIARRSEEEISYVPPSSPFSHPTFPTWGPLSPAQVIKSRIQEGTGTVVDCITPWRRRCRTCKVVKPPRKKRTEFRSMGIVMRKLVIGCREDRKARQQNIKVRRRAALY